MPRPIVERAQVETVSWVFLQNKVSWTAYMVSWATWSLLASEQRDTSHISQQLIQWPSRSLAYHPEAGLAAAWGRTTPCMAPRQRSWSRR